MDQNNERLHDPFVYLNQDVMRHVLKWINLKELKKKQLVSWLWHREIDSYIRARIKLDTGTLSVNSLTLSVRFPKMPRRHRTQDSDHLFYCEDIVEGVKNIKATGLPEIRGELITLKANTFFSHQFLHFILEYFSDETHSLTIYFDSVKVKRITGDDGENLSDLIESLMVCLL